MDIIRKILVLSFNTDWANTLRKKLNEHKKVSSSLASMRSDASKLISDEKFSTLIFEESFTAKNVNFILRALVSQNIEKPKSIIFLSSQLSFLKEIEVPKEFTSKVYFYSIPMNIATLVDLIQDRLLINIKSSSDLDQEFSKTLLKAATNIINTFPGIDNSLRPQKAFMLKDDLNIAIRGKIIIKSEFFQGSVFVSFPKESYLKIYEQMTGESHDDLNAGNIDFAGEVANMVYGQAKKILSQQGVNLDMAIPVTDRSETLKSERPIFVIPFETALGQLYIKVAQGLF